jgi:ABC-type bacteriocin/lantibiotic exporter with double-glycine peptidase domain
MEGFRKQNSIDPLIKHKSKKLNFTDYINTILPFLTKQKKGAVLGLAILMVTALLDFPLPLIYRFFIDRVILGERLDWVLGTLLVYGLCKFLAIAGNSLQNFYFNQFEKGIIMEIKHDLFKHILTLPKQFFDSQQIGYLMSRINDDVNSLNHFVSHTLLYATNSSVRLVAGIGLLFYLKWQLALIVIIILPLLLYAIVFFSRQIRLLSANQLQKQGEVNEKLQTAMQNITLIKSKAVEAKTGQTFGQKLDELFSKQMQQVSLYSAAEMVLHTIPEIAKFLVFAAGAYLIIQNQWTLGSLLAFIAYIKFVSGPLHLLAEIQLKFQEIRAALDRIDTLKHLVPERTVSGKAPPSLLSPIEFKQVYFSYNQEQWVLRDINVVINSGDWIALTGENGIGKTSLISLLLGFYLPNQGDILFNGHSIKELNLQQLRQKIAYVPQSPMIIQGTVLDNICYGIDDIHPDRVRRAAENAKFTEIMHFFPDGLDTQIEENGTNLSAGQKQSLALARALYQEADLFLMDEPTSSIDQSLEASIISSLKKILQGKTVILISHHPNITAYCQRRFILNQNRLEIN